jgi:isopenicillin-N N-acyltransferase-like protein
MDIWLWICSRNARLREQIHSQISIYDTMFQHTSNLAWKDVREVAAEFA